MTTKNKGYTNPNLLKEAKLRCANCYALMKKNKMQWCDKSDCDITAVLNCKEWEDEILGRL